MSSHQLYKPIIFYGALIILTQLIIFFMHGSLNLTAVLAVFLVVTSYCGSIVSLGVYGVKSFVDSMQKAGLPAEANTYEIGWCGDFRLRLKTPAGPMYVESVIGQYLTLRFRGPRTFGWKSISLFGIRKAGQKAAQKLLEHTKEASA